MDLSKLRRLDRRMCAMRDKQTFAGKFKENQYGVEVILPISDADKPDDVRESDWRGIHGVEIQVKKTGAQRPHKALRSHYICVKPP